MELSSDADCTVFISHAGTDKITIALPLRERLRAHSISAFVDEADMDPGAEAEKAMLTAMETAAIAVIVLSPEYVARKWPMKELMCFLRRRDHTARQSPCLPVIIPLFYRLSVSDLYDEPRLDRVDAEGRSLYHASRFLERMNNGEPEANIAEIKAALHKVHGIMGVRNDDGVSNDDGEEMTQRRENLLQILSDAILKAVPACISDINSNLREKEKSGDAFRAHFQPVHDVARLVFHFFSGENRPAQTTEGRLLEMLLDESTEMNQMIAIHGIGGVGKTSLLRAVQCLSDVKKRFRDGVYHVSVGTDCTRHKLLLALSDMVEKSGGTETASTMRAEKEFKNATALFRSWFDGRQCLFSVDDLWETEKISAVTIRELLRLHESRSESKVLLATRSAKIASIAGAYVRLEPREALGPESRSILVRYSGIEPQGDESDDFKVINEVLTRCSGLPIFLAAAGKSVKALSFRRGHERCAAYHAYSQGLAENLQQLLNTDVDEYERLSARLMVSVDVVEERRRVVGFPVPVRMAEMHRRLSVIKKQSRVPMTMLRSLWELADDWQAAFIAREFEQVGLADVEFAKRGSKYVELLRLHDSVYTFAVAEAKKYGENKSRHVKLLGGYAVGLQWNEYCREWWSESLQPDGYIHEEVCRHLDSASHHRELIELLLRPEWAYRVVMLCGVFSLVQDLSIGIRVLNDLREQGTDIFSDSSPTQFEKAFEAHSQSLEALERLLEAVMLSTDFLTKNPREAWFQIHGRLTRAVQGLSFSWTCLNFRRAIEKLTLWWKGSTSTVNRIKMYVKRMEAGGPRPHVRSVNPFLEGVGGASIRLIALDSEILCMEMMGDGIRVVCGCDDGRIAITNTQRGEVEREWHAHSSNVRSIAVERDGKRILSGSSDKTVKVWNLESGSCVTTFTGHTDTVTCVEFLKDGFRAVSASYDGTCRVWNVDTGRTLPPSFASHTGKVLCLAVLPDGDHIVSGGEDKALRVWNISNGSQIGPALIGHSNEVQCVAVTMDGRRIVSGSWDGLRSWSAESHVETDELIRSDEGTVLCVRLSTDGKRVLFGLMDDTVRVWDTQARRQACDPLVGHCNQTTGVLFLRGNSVASCSLDGTVRVWDLRRTGAKNRVVQQHSSAVTRVTFTPDGTRVVSDSGGDPMVRIWDTSSGRLAAEVFSLAPQVEWATPKVLSNLINANWSGAQPYVSISLDRLSVWNLKSRTCLRMFAHLRNLCVAVTPSGDKAVTGSSDRFIRLWDLRATHGNPINLGRHAFSVERVFVSEDGQRVISVDRFDNISVWDIRTGQRLRHLTKKDSRKQSRKYILDAVGEVTSLDDAGLLIPIHGREIMFRNGNGTIVLATMEAKVRDWTFSPDQRTICVGLESGAVALLRLEA